MAYRQKWTINIAVITCPVGQFGIPCYRMQMMTDVKLGGFGLGMETLIVVQKGMT